MSSINNGHKPRVPGSVDPNDNSNLSKIAKHQGIFQGPAGDDKADEGKGDGTQKGGKTAAKGPHHKVGAGAGVDAGGKGAPAVPGSSDLATPAGLISNPSTDMLENVATNPGASSSTGTTGSGAAVPSTDVLPPATGRNFAASDAPAIDAVNDLASSPDRLNDTLTFARGKLAQDIGDPKATSADLQKDIGNLTSALDQAGVTDPSMAAIINTMIDPYGTGEAPSKALQDATAAKGIDLSADKADPAAAKASLQKNLAQQPPLQTAVDLATANLMRANALAGSDPAVPLKDIAAGSADGSSSRAALFAAAAKAGVDLTGKDDDATASAKNKAAQGKVDQAEKKARAEKAQSAGSADATGGGQGRTGTGGGGAQTINNGSSYPSIPKTGPGSSAGGWDTSGNEPIGPNPDNPVDFERDYGIKGGFTSETLDDLLARVPSLTAQYPNIKEILTNAANSVSPPLPPQLLLSTLGVETSYATNPNNSQDGPFQFIASTFAAYGQGDRTNMQDAANACANYYKTLLQENGGDLFAAMRDYNGDVTKGASNSYQKDQQSIFNGNMG